MSSRQVKTPKPRKGKRQRPSRPSVRKPGTKEIRRKRQKSLTTVWVAHHEAAHAVANVRLELLCGGATIISHGSTLGVSGSENPLDIIPGHYDEHGVEVPDATGVDKGIVSLFAGYFGAVQAGQPKRQAECGASSDSAKADHFLRYTNTSRAVLRKRAAALVEENGAAIRALALELLERKTLPGEEIDLIVAEADGDPRARVVLETLRRGRS